MLLRLHILMIIAYVSGFPSFINAEELKLDNSHINALKHKVDFLDNLEFTGRVETRLTNNSELLSHNIDEISPTDRWEESRGFVSKISGTKLYEKTVHFRDCDEEDCQQYYCGFDGNVLSDGIRFPGDNSLPGIISIMSIPDIKKRQYNSQVEVRVFLFTYLHSIGFDIPIKSLLIGQRAQHQVLSRGKQGEFISIKENHDSDTVIITVEYPEPWASSLTGNIEEHFSDLPIPWQRTLKVQAETERRRIVNTYRRCKYTFDKNRNYCLIDKTEVRLNGSTENIISHTEYNNFVMIDNSNEWFPKHVATEYYAHPELPSLIFSSPIYTEVCIVKSIKSIKPSKDDFKVWFNIPGVQVSDYTSELSTPGSPYMYIVSSGIESLGKLQAKNKRSYSLYIILSFNLLALLIFTFYMIKKRRTNN